MEHPSRYIILIDYLVTIFSFTSIPSRIKKIVYSLKTVINVSTHSYLVVTQILYLIKDNLQSLKHN